MDDVNTLESLTIGPIAAIGAGSLNGLGSAVPFIGTYGYGVPLLAGGLAVGEVISRAAEGDVSGSVISLAANGAGIYAGVTASEVVANASSGLIRTYW